MKKVLTSIVFATAGAFLMNSCIFINYPGFANGRISISASGEDSTLVFPDIAATYYGLDIANSMKVSYTKSADVISVTADKNLIPYIKVYIEDGELNINMNGLALSNVKSPIVTVPVSSRPLTSIEVSGASSFSSDVLLECKELSIDVSGASKAETEASVKELDAEASGASTIIISGVAREAEFECSGASKIDCDGFSVDFATVDVSGASRIGKLSAKAASGSVSGASHLSVKNGCDVTKVSSSGASGISHE